MRRIVLEILNIIWFCGKGRATKRKAPPPPHILHGAIVQSF